MANETSEVVNTFQVFGYCARKVGVIVEYANGMHEAFNLSDMSIGTSEDFLELCRLLRT